MAYRKKTIRRMPPQTKKFARLVRDLDILVGRAKKLVKEMAKAEKDSILLNKKTDAVANRIAG